MHVAATRRLCMPAVGEGAVTWRLEGADIDVDELGEDELGIDINELGEGDELGADIDVDEFGTMEGRRIGRRGW